MEAGIESVFIDGRTWMGWLVSLSQNSGSGKKSLYVAANSVRHEQVRSMPTHHTHIALPLLIFFSILFSNFNNTMSDFSHYKLQCLKTHPHCPPHHIK